MTATSGHLPRKPSSARWACATACKASPPSCPRRTSCEWMRAAYDAGQREIEVGSFVPARLLPQLADTAEVLAFAQDACPA